MTELITTIRNKFPDCAITLSLGERHKESYQKLFYAGANRYLLREETADAVHYSYLHPPTMSFSHRMQCLQNLKDIGYQTGCGFLVGTPKQSPEDIASDLLFIQDFKPDMVGIGPFIPHKDTPFKNISKGSVSDTLLLLSILRIMLPEVLLPATTALGTADEDGTKLGILAGANVIMINLTPERARKHYQLYDNKNRADSCVKDTLAQIKTMLKSIHHEIVITRGDAPRTL